MRTRISKIDDRLDRYGASLCPICGNRRETVFGSVAGELVCREHPGHPLHIEPADKAAFLELVSA